MYVCAIKTDLGIIVDAPPCQAPSPPSTKDQKKRFDMSMTEDLQVRLAIAVLRIPDVLCAAMLLHHLGIVQGFARAW